MQSGGYVDSSVEGIRKRLQEMKARRAMEADFGSRRGKAKKKKVLKIPNSVLEEFLKEKGIEL